jgi:hypothetical protein
MIVKDIADDLDRFLGLGRIITISDQGYEGLPNRSAPRTLPCPGIESDRGIEYFAAGHAMTRSQVLLSQPLFLDRRVGKLRPLRTDQLLHQRYVDLDHVASTSAPEKRYSSHCETGPEKPQSKPGDNPLRGDIRLAGAVEKRARSKCRHSRPSGRRRRCIPSASQAWRSGQPKTCSRFRKARCECYRGHLGVVEGHAPGIPER